MKVLVSSSASFEYICYGTTVIINILFYSFNAGIAIRRQNRTFIIVYVGQTSKFGPWAEIINIA